MLIACASDAHGARSQMIKIIDALPRVDAFCFLGDCDRDADWLEEALKERYPLALFHAVAGNNDPFSSRPKTLLRAYEKNRMLLTHGHLFGVKHSYARLAAFAATQGCALALFGHTHCQAQAQQSGVLLVNPGALNQGKWALLETGDTPSVSLEVLS